MFYSSLVRVFTAFYLLSSSALCHIVCWALLSRAYESKADSFSIIDRTMFVYNKITMQAAKQNLKTLETVALN